MQDVAIEWVAAENVGDDFAESVGIQTFVEVLDGVVDVFLFGRDAALSVTIVHALVLLETGPSTGSGTLSCQKPRSLSLSKGRQLFEFQFLLLSVKLEVAELLHVLLSDDPLFNHLADDLALHIVE